MSAEPRLECLLTVTRHAAGGPELAVVEDPRTSLLGADAPSPLWSGPRMRVSPAGDVALLAADGSSVARFGADGAPGPVTRLPGGGRIADWLAAADGSVVLLENDGGRNVLRMVDGGGAELWRRGGPTGIRALDWDALQGSFGSLLADGAGNVYLVAERPHAAVARIGDGGALAPVADLGPPGVPVQMDAAGRLFSVGYDPETRRRSWNTLDPGTDERQVVWCDAEATAALELPIGADRTGRAYGAAGTSLACVDASGGVAWRFAVHGAVPRADGTVLSAVAADSDALDVTAWTAGAAPERFRLPLPRPSDGRELAWRLLGSAADGGHLVWGGARSGAPDVLAELGPDGDVRDLADPAPADARLRGWWPAPASGWRVDADGRAYVPLAGPDDVAVLRLSVA